jgi:ATP-binding cassette, subfamily G (WHITE), member 2
MKGTILFDGASRSDDIAQRSAYVMQDNVHLPMLTIRQTLKYASLLRMPERVSPKLKQARVKQIITMLGLTEHADTIVGDARVRGISGGQAKRLSIGVEIINLPDIIFLDEPTSGLDSSISLEVVGAIRMLASQNRTIVATIHQPSTALYGMFDKLLLMAEGHVIYYGEATSAVNYFVSSPYAFQYIRGSNPAEFVIAVAGSLQSDSSTLTTVDPCGDKPVCSVNDIVSYYHNSPFYEELLKHVDCTPTRDDEFLPVVSSHTSAFNTSTLFQIRVLTQRDLNNKLKDPYATIVDAMMHLMVSLFYGSIYYHLDNTQYQERMCVLFFSMIFMIMGHQKQMPVIFRERLLFYRERSAGAYGPLSYWVTTILVTFPFVVLNVFIYAITVHHLVGLRTAPGNFVDFYVTLLLISVTGMFACRAVAALAPSEQAAINLFPALIQFLMAFAGFGIFLPVMQTWLAVWAPYITFVR